MKRVLAIPVVVILALLLVSAGFAGAPFGNSGPLLVSASYAADHILVSFDPGASPSQMAEIHRRCGGEVLGTIDRIGIQLVRVPDGRAADMARAYASNPWVASAEPDYMAQAIGIPNDPGLVNQWGLSKIQATEAWGITTGTHDINVAVLDTGVDLSHPDLASKVVASRNFSDSPTESDVHGHGSHVAGIAASSTNNGMGVAGLGYDSTIMNVKVLGDGGYGAYSWIAQGIIWAADNGAEVINMSLGGTTSSSTLELAVNYAWSKGVVVVAAAGNYGSSSPVYPASYTNVMAVAATDINDSRAAWSNYGSWVDVAAPGVSIYSTLKGGTYGYKSGTSMAAPFVSGLAALVYDRVVDTSGNGVLNDEVRTQIENTCDSIAATGMGSGRINAFEAVQVQGDGIDNPVNDPVNEPVTDPVTTGSVEGTVIDSVSGTSIAGARVSDGVRAVMTDGNGYYLITDIPEGACTIAVSASGYSGSSSEVTVVAEQTVAANFSLDLLPPPAVKSMWVQSIGFAVAGKNLKVDVIVDSESGAVAGARVMAQLTDGVDIWNLDGTTDGTGRIAFVNKAGPGDYVVTISNLSADGYVWDTTQGVSSATCTIASKK